MPKKYLANYLCGVASYIESKGTITIDDGLLEFNSDGVNFAISIEQIVNVEIAEVDDLKKAAGSYLALGMIGLSATGSMAKNRLMKITFKDSVGALQSAEFKFLPQSVKEVNFYQEAATEISRLKQNISPVQTAPQSSNSPKMAEEEPAKTPEHQPFLTVNHKKFRRTRYLLLAAIAALLIVLVIITGFIIITGPKTTVTGLTLHIQYPNADDSYFGAATQSVPINIGQSNILEIDKGQQFYLSFSFSASNLESINHSITGMTVSTTGFTIISANPNTPITLTPGNSTTITINFQSPSSSYTGPVDVAFTVS
jgi:hypothetical protein